MAKWLDWLLGRQPATSTTETDVELASKNFKETKKEAETVEPSADPQIGSTVDRVEIKAIDLADERSKQLATRLLVKIGLSNGDSLTSQDERQWISMLIRHGIPISAANKMQRHFVVAILDGEIIGVAKYHPMQGHFGWAAEIGNIGLINKATSSANLTQMGILPEHRGKNIGTKLLQATMRDAKARGFVQLYGFAEATNKPHVKPTSEENERLCLFYERNGFHTGGDSEHAPFEIFGDFAQQVGGFRRQGTWFWRSIRDLE